MYSLPSNL